MGRGYFGFTQYKLSRFTGFTRIFLIRPRENPVNPRSSAFYSNFSAFYLDFSDKLLLDVFLGLWSSFRPKSVGQFAKLRYMDETMANASNSYISL